MSSPLHIALVGNPNSGKSSIFNSLTGLNQKIGNFPGVTVDKKTGISNITGSLRAYIIDLPGAYSLYPKRHDEWVSYKVLLNQDKETSADIFLLIADASNLKRNLLFCSQLIDLKKPVIVALTMMDIAKKKNIQIDIAGLERELGVPVIPVNPRKNKGLKELRKAIDQIAGNLNKTPARDFIDSKAFAPEAIKEIQNRFPGFSDYRAIHYLINHENFDLDKATQEAIEKIEIKNKFNATKTQAEEIVQRYGHIKHIMQQTVVEADPLQKALFTEKLDNILLHRTWGYVILITVLFLLFQSIFWMAQYPMDAIEWSFARLSGYLGNTLSESWFSNVLINGVLAGLSGIMIFIPQIMILFGLITLLEDTGYMARISFLTDRLMRKAGLNGKSVMPMISGLACAVPAIMSARSIENKKERLLTIMCTPLMSCSARLPVYAILIALIIPKQLYFGFLSLQGLVMMALYLLGTVMALLTAYIFKWFIKSIERSFFILELPVYRGPRWRNIFYTMIEKAKVFVFDAGKVIMVISLLLWVLSSYGPKERMKVASEKYEMLAEKNPSQVEEYNKARKTALLENSYAGILGKAIEPSITPLGYDWKIGIALITSFAAREVFVGTMATLYSVGEGNDNDNTTLRQKMAAAVRPDGTKVYNVATGLSLLVFYVLAMQCMSTLAVVKRETRSWKWPIIQLIYMTGLAYVISWLVYNIFK
ncbi:MAG: ferrous iron transport protein B [Chitinophagaceae bacterium]|nr:ferrous iron transport protein B [Chitinophagaceae bacterium]